MNYLNVFLPCGISDQIAVVKKAKTEDLRPKTTRTTGSGFGFSHLKNTPKLRPLFEFTANYSAINNQTLEYSSSHDFKKSHDNSIQSSTLSYLPYTLENSLHTPRFERKAVLTIMQENFAFTEK